MSVDDRSSIPPVKSRGVDTPPYVVDRSKLRRFDRKNLIFRRVSWDSSWDGYKRMYDEKVFDIISSNKDGYSRVDFALAYASWIVHDAFTGGFSWKKIAKCKDSVATAGIDWRKIGYEVDDPDLMSNQVKRAAKSFGASLVGVGTLDRSWLYANAQVPRRCGNVIVMAVAMDAPGIAASPAVPAAVATGIGYSKMAFILAGVGEFIRNLGYEAIQCGNDTALSIPLAIDAGLGELGRNGLLITPQFGPRVRLCKIFTDIPMDVDTPIEFGVQKYCKTCKRCAENCKANAISTEDEPTFNVACQSNNPGVLRWPVNSERCYLYWCENGVDCSTCIKVCPYNVVTAM